MPVHSAIMLMNTDRISRAVNVEVPDEFIDQEPRFLELLVNHADVWIGLPDVEDDAAVTADVPAERLAKSAKSFARLLNSLNESSLRFLFVGYPSAKQAEAVGLDFAEYEKLHWAAVDADYEMIASDGSQLRKIIEAGKSMHITSPAGTDLTVSLNSRPVSVWDGTVKLEDAKKKTTMMRAATLPDGAITFAPVEDTAEGKVVVPKTKYRNKSVEGISFHFSKGMIEQLEIQTGQSLYDEVLNAFPEQIRRIGVISIGLNPALRVMEDEADFRPIDAAGMVWVNTGNNILVGGENEQVGQLEFPITNATVTVDGKVIVKDGKLAL
jgi:aminopeptidase